MSKEKIRSRAKQKEDDDVRDGGQAWRVEAPDAASMLRIDSGKDVQFLVPRNLSVVLAARAFSQLFGYADATDLEVSLLGIVERDGPVFRVREFFLVAQKGSSAHTELDQEAVAELVERLIAHGRSDDVRKIRCWAHSHPGMNVFWSQTDDDNCRRLAADWLLSIVVSDGFRIRCRLDVTSPIPFTIDNVPVFLESPVDPEVAAQCEEEVKEKLQRVSLFGGHERRKLRAGGEEEDGAFELVEYCDLCGSWHPEGECPMQYESGYDLAREDSALASEADTWEDDVWF